MTSGILCGAGLGVGLWALVVWAFPPRPALAHVLRRLNAEAPPPQRIQRLTATPRLRGDLVVVGKSLDAHVSQKAISAGFGLLVPVLANVVVATFGVGRTWTVTAVIAVGFAAVGFMAPDFIVRRTAERRRTTFRHALGAYFNLVRVLLAGGAGVDTALSTAADVGTGWVFHRLRYELLTAQVTRSTVWQAFARLGDELNERSLRELAASVSLTGTEGAKIRASLRAKAAALRVRGLAEAEGEAHAATERMTLPVVLLLAGFLMFIGYPATMSVLNGL